MCLLVIYVSTFEKCLFKFLPILQSGWFPVVVWNIFLKSNKN